MRRMLLALTCLVLALAASALAGPRAPVPAKPAAVTATTFVVSGRGWGHGVGMSQYGALGFANDGWTYDQILAHFYVGAVLGPAPVARVRVLVGEAKGAVKLRSKVPFRVRDVFGKTYPLPAGELVLGPKLWVTVNGASTELAGPILFLPGTEPLELDRPYRGQIEVGVTGQKLNAVNVVGLEDYLQGVVPREMPSAWHDEALKAQAVAARSYALSHRVSGKSFDLYADVRSQVYGGIVGESPRTTAAVQATKGEVLLWEGKPIDALFHSTSGGKTLSAVEVFGKPVPYLVSVDDPHSSLSPVNRWGPTPIPETTIRKGLKLRAPLTALKLTRGVSGRVSERRRRDVDRNVEGHRRHAPLGRRAALDVDHRSGDSLAHAAGRARGLRQAAERYREGGRREGGGALAADRRRLDAGRRPRPNAGVQGEAPRAGELPHLGGQALQRRAEGSGRAGRDRARRRHLDRVRSREAARPRHDGRAAGRPRERLVDGGTDDDRAGRRVHDRAARARAVQSACGPCAGICRGAFGTDRAPVKRFALVVVAAALLAPAADAGRYAVGVRTVADLPRLQAALPKAESLAPIPALVVEQATPPRLVDLPGAVYVERLGTRRLAFVPNDPLAAKQWHLTATRAFDFWDTSALALALPPVRVAIIDSGVDATHPDLVNKIVEGGTKSFVGGSATVDNEGHGTFVAGLIAATVDNTAGIAGMAATAELLIAKVVVGGDVIDVEAEAKAIRWAVQNDAKVINLSLGGLRDPRDPDRDTFSPLEAAAVAYAYGKGVVVIAAVGNAEQGATTAWPYASYPAALPHVLGVSALARDGSVPLFSNRDKIYNDIAAPGAGIISTVPLELTAPFKECLDQGFSSCGPDEWRKGEGTSFAAPQVTAAAAVLLAVRPNLRPEQVTALLTETARDVSAATGCQIVPDATRRLHRVGPTRRHGRAAPAQRPDPAPGRVRAERRRRRRTRRPSGGRRGGSRRLSTSGTTRTTSTRSGFGAASPSSSACEGLQAPTRT